MRDSRRPSGNLAFIAATISLVIAYAATATPVPLYNTYRAENGITNAGLAVTVVAYFLATVVALLCLGRISNHVGRRPAALATLLLLTAGCLVLIGLTGTATLLIGRVLMGIGAGLASSTLTAYIVDSAPARPAWLASAVTFQSIQIGLTIGALLSGSIVEYGPAPRQVAYVVMIAALAACALLLLLAPETSGRHPGALASLRPRVYLPPKSRVLLPVATFVFVGTWAMGAFYQAFSPSVVADQLHTRNAVVVALVFSAYMATNLFGAPLSGAFDPATAQRVGMTVFLAGVGGLLLSLASGSVVGFLLASVIAGTGQGTAVSATIHGLLHGVSSVDRAPVMAATYLVSYLGAAIPSLIAGQLTHSLDLLTIAYGYGVLALAAWTVTLVFARNPVDW